MGIIQLSWTLTLLRLRVINSAGFLQTWSVAIKYFDNPTHMQMYGEFFDNLQELCYAFSEVSFFSAARRIIIAHKFYYLQIRTSRC